MKIINKNDYNATIKTNDRDIKCYTKKKLDELYHNGNYKIIGEISKNNKKEGIDKIVIANKEFIVSKYNKNNNIMFRKYFIQVGKDEYICLLKSRLFIFLLIPLMLGIAFGISSIFYMYFNTKTLAPDYPLPEEDEQAIKIEEDSTKKVENENGSGSVRVRLGNTAIVNLSTGIIQIAYQNPNQSSHDSVITLVLIKDDKEYYIARSGLIKTGNQITQLNLDTSEIKLTEGIYKGKFIIDHYNPETGEKALTNSSFNDIEIYVNR